jgi:hypothetical protein
MPWFMRASERLPLLEAEIRTAKARLLQLLGAE